MSSVQLENDMRGETLGLLGFLIGAFRGGFSIGGFHGRGFRQLSHRYQYPSG